MNSIISPPLPILASKSWAKHPRRVLAILSFVIFILIQSGGLSGDTGRRLNVTHSLWTSSPEVVEPDEYYGIPGRSGLLRSNWGIGQPLLMLPGDVIGTALAKIAPVGELAKRRLRATVVAFVTFPLLNTLTVLVAYELLRSLGLAASRAALASLGLVLLSTFLFFAHFHIENSLLLLCTLSAYLGVARWLSLSDPRWLAVTGIAIAYSLVTRLPAAMDGACVGIFGVLLTWKKVFARRPEWGRRAAEVGTIVVPAVVCAMVIDRAYQWIRFGSLTNTYSSLWGQMVRRSFPDLPATYPFCGPFVDGMVGPFLSLDKSVFLFDPLVLLPLLLLTSRSFRKSPLLLLWIAGLIETVLLAAFHAKLAFWGGDTSWSDRFVSVGVHVCCLAALGGTVRFWRDLKAVVRVVILIVCAASFMIQISSLVYNPNLEIGQRVCRGSATIFVIYQRFVNIAAGATGNFSNWNLLCDTGFTASARATQPDFLAFVLDGLVPQKAIMVVKLAWGLGIVACAVFTALFIRLLIQRAKLETDEMEPLFLSASKSPDSEQNSSG